MANPVAVFLKTQKQFLPLPGGEGRGEGERKTNYSGNCTGIEAPPGEGVAMGACGFLDDDMANPAVDFLKTRKQFLLLLGETFVAWESNKGNSVEPKA